MLRWNWYFVLIRLWVSLSPFRRVQQNLRLKHLNPIVAALKTKHSKNRIEFRRSHDIPWLMLTKDCEGEFLCFYENSSSTDNYCNRSIYWDHKNNTGICERNHVNGFVGVCRNCSVIVYSSRLRVKRELSIFTHWYGNRMLSNKRQISKSLCCELAVLGAVWYRNSFRNIDSFALIMEQICCIHSSGIFQVHV